MTHNYVQNNDFNILTVKLGKGGVFHVTGETKEPLMADDYINYPVGRDSDILMVTNIIKRRDSRDFPKGNKLFYEIHCRQSPRPVEEPTVKSN
jgi:hypothetical protein